MDTAGKVAKKILSAYPDYGKAPPEYIFNFAEALSYLTEDEMAIVTNPRNGVASRCQFLPTIADVHALLREHKAKAEQNEKNVNLIELKTVQKYVRQDN
jgi:hypothetical protein